jgi:soluble cytochrome b562
MCPFCTDTSLPLITEKGEIAVIIDNAAKNRPENDDDDTEEPEILDFSHALALFVKELTKAADIYNRLIKG